MKVLEKVPWDDLTTVVEGWMNTPRVKAIVQFIGLCLSSLGVPETHLPDAEQILLCVGAIVTTLVSYYYWFGHRHRLRRKDLEQKLKQVTF